MTSPIQIKRDPVLLGFAAVLVLAAAFLVHHGDVSWKEAALFLGTSLALPGLFGATKTEDPS